MSNLMEDAAGWLGERLKENAGLAGVYERTGVASASITASVALHDYEVIDEDTGLPETVRAYDWTFTPADLVVAGQLITPRPGDRWKPTIAGVQETYEVLPIGKLPCFDRLDAHGVLLLVHTKKVA